MKVLKKVGSVFKIIFIIFAVIVVFCSLFLFVQKKFMKVKLPNIFGYAIASVISGSMEPNISIGDLVVVNVYADYYVNDVIMYRRGLDLVVHRLVEIDGDNVITKGDANNTVDDMHTRDDVVGKVVKVVPNVGTFLMYLSKFKWYIVIILLLCAFIF